MESVNTLSMGWLYYVCPMLVGVSMESMDTLSRGYPWVGYTMYVQCWSEYPWNPRILCQGGIHGLAILCMSNVVQSIHGIRGYFAKGYQWVGHIMYVQRWSGYPWNLQILCQGGIHGLAILCMSNVGQSIHGIRGYFAKGVSMGWPYYVYPMLVSV